MQVTLDYEHPTTLIRHPDTATLDFAVNRSRQPVQFYGRVKDPLLLRQMLLALHEVMLSKEQGSADIDMVLDPTVTIQHDEIIFEAFSASGSCYAQLSAPLTAFEITSEVRYGTTTIDFAEDLHTILSDLRSSRPTYLALGAARSGTQGYDRAKMTIDLAAKQLKGYLQVQSALSLRNLYTIDVRPADLLTISAFIQENRATRSPKGLRYELRKDEPITVVLEPWNKRFVLRETFYRGYDRTVRVWGRQRLRLLDAILPYAQRVTVGVLGRGLPHIYLCRCGPYRFQLALSGWATNDWSVGNAFDLLAPLAMSDPNSVNRVAAYLSEHLAATRDGIAEATGLVTTDVEGAVFALCRSGRAMFDLATRQYRLRDLFAEPIDAATLFGDNPRLVTAQRLFAEGRVTLDKDSVQRNRTEVRTNATVRDGTEYAVTIAVADDGRLRYGRCHCPFFEANLMQRGPCEHILAARLAADAAQQYSVPASPALADAANTDDDDDDLEDEEMDDAESESADETAEA